MLKMKKILCLCAIILLLISSVCMATDGAVNSSLPNDTQSEETPEHLSVVSNDLYLHGDNVVVEKITDGNVFAIGNNVSIKGEIIGDLFALANTITIEKGSVVSGNVFACTKNLIIDGEVIDVYALANNFTLNETGIIYRDLKLYSSNCTINSYVAKDAYIYTNTISFKPDVSGLIEGSLKYSSQEELSIPEGVVLGDVTYTPLASAVEPSIGDIIKLYVGSFINILAYAIVVILLFIYLMPSALDKFSYCLSKKPFITAGIGIVGIIILPLLAILAMISMYLTYLGVAMFAAYVFMLSITISIFGIAIGNFIANKLKNKTKFKTFLLSIISVIVVWLLQLVPYIGSFVSLFTVVFGLGIILFSLFIKKDVSATASK